MCCFSSLDPKKKYVHQPWVADLYRLHAAAHVRFILIVPARVCMILCATLWASPSFSIVSKEDRDRVAAAARGEKSAATSNFWDLKKG